MYSFDSYSPFWPLLLAVVFAGFGCESTEPEVITDYKITGFHTAILSADHVNTELGKVSGMPLEEGDEVPFDQLALSFESKKNISVSGKKAIFPEIFSSQVFSPFTSDSISEISVFSHQDFDEEFKAGDNLNDKFIILADGIEQSCGKSYPISLSEFNDRPRQGRGSFTLVLKEKPSLYAAHKFTVHYRKTDKSLYILQFPEIIVY